MAYFLKLVGLSTDPLPARWWEQRPEIARGMFFKQKPRAVGAGDVLVYYAVGGDGRLCGVAEVGGDGTGKFEPPAGWNERMRGKFKWRMPVRLLHSCAADESAPRLAGFQRQRVGQGSYQELDEERAREMIDAIAARDVAGR